MSTRSMVIVRQPYSGDGKNVPLYRNCDGYLSEAGASIVDVLRSGPEDCEAVVAGLLSLRYPASEYRARSEPIYRAATWQPEEQEDLEHVYMIAPAYTRQDSGNVRPAVTEWTVTHYARQGWSEGGDDYRKWLTGTYSLAQLAEAVNRERKASNARAKARGYEPPYAMVTP